MIEECVIIGGGVAGLSAANQLADRGISPLLVDGGAYPCHRVCGEYFSHECCHSILEKWGIRLSRQIGHARWIQGRKQIEIPIPQPAAVCSRFEFDIQLLERAVKKGPGLFGRPRSFL